MKSEDKKKRPNPIYPNYKTRKVKPGKKLKPRKPLTSGDIAVNDVIQDFALAYTLGYAMLTILRKVPGARDTFVKSEWRRVEDDKQGAKNSD